MTRYTRNQSGTGVTPKGAPLTQVEVDENWIQLVAADASKLPLAGGTITGNLTVNGDFNATSSSTDNFNFNNSYAGSSATILQLASTAGNNSAIFIAKSDGTGEAAYKAESSSGNTLGYLKWASTGDFELEGYLGASLLNIDAARGTIAWTGGSTDVNYEFNDSGSEYFRINYANASDLIRLEGSKQTTQLSGDIYTELCTSNTTYETHYKVSSAGYHYTDGPGYDGILQRAHFARTMLSTTAAGTSTLIGGIPLTSSSVKTATGTYEYTIDSDVVAPYDEAKKCVAGNFVVTGSVVGSSGASNAKIMNTSYTGDHTFTVYTMDSAGTLADSTHRLVIFW